MYSFLPPRLRGINLSILIFLYNLILHVTLCFQLSVKLIKLLLKGTLSWVSMVGNVGRLMMFITLLAPGWYNLMSYFLFDPHVVRNIAYSNKSITSRNFLDLYLPPPYSKQNLEPSIEVDGQRAKKVPVIIFVSGGAWVIGYKMWSALVARALSSLGTICICPDYRNAPQGDIDSMMDDITASIKWTISNIDKYGGDKHHIILAGQSAGAHISMMLMLESYENLMTPEDYNVKSTVEIQSECKLTQYEFEQIKLVIGVSGPYNLHILDKHLHKRGLDTTLLHWVCNNDVYRYSPTLRLKQINQKMERFSFLNKLKSKVHFPPIALYHGSNDVTVPSSICVEFAEELKRCHFDVSANIYPDLSHTDLILEGPLTGDNQLLRDMITLVRQKQIQRFLLNGSRCDEVLFDTMDSSVCSSYNIDRPLAPKWIVRIAKKMNPF